MLQYQRNKQGVGEDDAKKTKYPRKGITSARPPQDLGHSERILLYSEQKARGKSSENLTRIPQIFPHGKKIPILESLFTSDFWHFPLATSGIRLFLSRRLRNPALLISCTSDQGDSPLTTTCFCGRLPDPGGELSFPYGYRRGRVLSGTSLEAYFRCQQLGTARKMAKKVFDIRNKNPVLKIRNKMSTRSNNGQLPEVWHWKRKRWKSDRHCKGICDIMASKVGYELVCLCVA